jgi:hypothetical protein
MPPNGNVEWYAATTTQYASTSYTQYDQGLANNGGAAYGSFDDEAPLLEGRSCPQSRLCNISCVQSACLGVPACPLTAAAPPHHINDNHQRRAGHRCVRHCTANSFHSPLPPQSSRPRFPRPGRPSHLHGPLGCGSLAGGEASLWLHPRLERGWIPHPVVCAQFNNGIRPRSQGLGRLQLLLPAGVLDAAVATPRAAGAAAAAAVGSQRGSRGSGGAVGGAHGGKAVCEEGTQPRGAIFHCGVPLPADVHSLCAAHPVLTLSFSFSL